MVSFAPTSEETLEDQRLYTQARLTEVANFFRQTEPHSPVSYLVERAIKWSQMPLDAWLASVIKDGTVLDALRDTLGIEGESYPSYEDTGENV